MAGWRSWFGLPVALVVLHSVLAWVGRAPGLLTGEDDVRYLILGRALKIGQYRELWSPTMPPHHMYPPGYPALLAAWSSIGGTSFSWLVVLQILLSAGTLIFTFAALRRVVPPAVAIGSLLILSVSPPLLHAAGTVMSETPLAFCFAVAFWASVCLERGARQSVILVAIAVVAPMMRTIGVVLPVAVVVDWLLARRYRDALVATTIFVATIGPLFAWTMSDPVVVTGNSYAADLVHKAVGLPLWHTMLNRVGRNGIFYFTQGIPVNLPVPSMRGSRIDNVLATLVIATAFAVGLLPSFRRIRIPCLIVAATGLLLSIWPWPVARYLAPGLPLLVPMLLLGIQYLGVRRSPRVAVISVMSVAAIIAATGATQAFAKVAGVLPCDRSQSLPDTHCMAADKASFFNLVRYVNDSLPRDARFVAAKAAPLYYYTSRQAIPAVQLAGVDSAGFWTRLQAERASYVVLGSLHWSEWPLLAAQLERRCTDLVLLASFPPRTYLFRFDPPGAAAGSRTPAVHDERACVAVRQYQHDALLLPH